MVFFHLLNKQESALACYGSAARNCERDFFGSSGWILVFGVFLKLNFNLQRADFEVLFDRDSEMHVKKVQCQGTRYLESDSS